MAETEAEKIKIKGHTLHEILDDDFIEELEESSDDGKIFPIAVVFVNEYMDNEDKAGEMISLNHETPEEIENKEMHIESRNPELVQAVREVLENDS